MNAIFTIACKDLRLMSRDKGEMFFTFVFPMILATFFGFVFAGGGDGGSKIDLAVVIESDATLARDLARDLAEDGAFEVTQVPQRALAEELVRKGRVTAAIILPASMQDSAAGLFSGGGIPIEALVDPSRRAEIGLIQGKLNELAFRQLSAMFTDADSMRQLMKGARESVARATDLSPTQKLAAGALIAAGGAFSDSIISRGSIDGEAPHRRDASGWSPVSIKIEELAARKGGPRDSFDVSFPQGIVWGLAGCVMAFATSLVSERVRGTLDRLRLAPITRGQLLAGKGVACFTTALLVQLVLLALTVFAFSSHVQQPLRLLLAFLAAAFAFSGISMFIAGACRTEAQAQGAGRGALLLLAIIGGGSLPLFLMPPFFKTVSLVSPFRWAVAAIEGPFWRDTPFSDQLLPLAVLVAIGAVGLGLGVQAMRAHNR